MDENVVFNPGGQDNSAKPSTELPPQEVSGQAVSSEVAPVGITADTTAPSESTQPQVVEGSEIQSEQAPPSGPPPRTGGWWKKIIIGVVILVLIVGAFAIFLPKGASNEKVKLVWWGLWEDQAVIAPLLTEFNKSNPNITVEYIKQDPKQYREKLTTRIKNGSGPDIFRYHNTWVPMMSDSLLPLSTDVMSPNEFKKTFYPVMQKDLTQNGGIYGIPLGADSLGLFVNTELLEAAGIEPPQNWDDFVKAARALTVKDEGKIKTAGAALGTYGNITHAPDIISLLFIQQGIDMEKFASAAKDDKVEALDFYTSFATGDQNVWDGTLDESLLSFARGNLAMYIGFSWDIFRIESLNKELAFTTYPLPQLVGRTATLSSYWVEGVSSKSKNQKEALLFMQYLSKKETAQKFYTEASKKRAFGEPYAQRALANSLKENKLLYPFVSQLGSASSSFFASDTNDGEGGINSTSNTYLGNAINSIIDDNNSAESAVETLDKGVAQVFQKYGIR